MEKRMKAYQDRIAELEVQLQLRDKELLDLKKELNKIKY